MTTHCEWNRLGGFVWALACATSADAAVVTLKAVKKNGLPIQPTGTLTVLPGDAIEAELLVADWAVELPDGIRSYEIIIQGEKGAVSGANGLVLPTGWHADVQPPVCTTVLDCDPGLDCQVFCVESSHNPAVGAFIDINRPDYLLFSLDPIVGVATSTLNYKYFGVVFDSVGVIDPGKPLYLGTLKLEIDEDACGTFRFGLAACGISLLSSVSLKPITPTLVPLVLQLPGCPVLPIASEPPNCKIDARIPHDPGFPANSLTWQTLEMSFTGNPNSLGSASFRTRRVPAGPVPTVNSVFPLGGNSLRLGLSTPIEPGVWTCVEHRASHRELCVAPLPADVDQNQRSDTDDVLVMVTNLRAPGNTPLLPVIQCDTNRSGKCTPLDLLFATDLLAGRGFAVWNNAELASSCPSVDDLNPRLPRGACCTRFSGCIPDSLETSCLAADQLTWFRDATCCEEPCDQITGACCDAGSGSCRNAIPSSDCVEFSEEWTEGDTCAQVSCQTSLGACCNVDSGSCDNGVTRSNCSGSSDVWYPGLSCSEFDCIPG